VIPGHRVPVDRPLCGQCDPSDGHSCPFHDIAFAVGQEVQMRRFSSPTETTEPITAIAFAPMEAVAGELSFKLFSGMSTRGAKVRSSRSRQPRAYPIGVAHCAPCAYLAARRWVAFRRIRSSTTQRCILRLLDAQPAPNRPSRSIKRGFHRMERRYFEACPGESNGLAGALLSVKNGTFSVTFRPMGTTSCRRSG
jgi:hypothetical protein